MRAIVSVLAVLLIVIGVGRAPAFAPRQPPTGAGVRETAAMDLPAPRPTPAPYVASRIPTTGSAIATQTPPVVPDPTQVPAAATPVLEKETRSTWLPITRIEIPSIGLRSEVVSANLVKIPGGQTWAVPSFRVGHGQYTAGAGQPGNAVLLGHVASLHDGSVFRDLHQVRVGDTIRVFSGTRRFDYRVFDKRLVLPDDLSVLRPTTATHLVLITCAGVWLPSIQDYSERLAVRASLISTVGGSGAGT